MSLGSSFVDPDSIASALATLPQGDGRSRDRAAAGLFRDLGGLTFRAIAARLDTTPRTASSWYAAHRSASLKDAAYANLVARLSRLSLDESYGRDFLRTLKRLKRV